MIINSSVFHQNGFFVHAAPGPDFWMFLSRHVGWGRFTMFDGVREPRRKVVVFELAEILPVSSAPPENVIDGSNVMWRLTEAVEVIKDFRPDLVPEGW